MQTPISLNEGTFDVLQVMAEGRPEVIGLRSRETIEQTEEMVGLYLKRERVTRIWE